MGPRLLSRQGIHHLRNYHCRVLNHRSTKLLQIEPYVVLFAAVKPNPLEGVVSQGTEEYILFDWPSQEERVTFLPSVMGNQ